jgi:hypothetical protein
MFLALHVIGAVRGTEVVRGTEAVRRDMAHSQGPVWCLVRQPGAGKERELAPRRLARGGRSQIEMSVSRRRTGMMRRSADWR